MELFEKKGLSLLCLLPIIIMFSSSVVIVEAARVNLVGSSNDEKVGGIIIFSTTVQIFNNLDQQNKLTVHYKSSDDDLGAHVLLNNQSYTFKF